MRKDADDLDFILNDVEAALNGDDDGETCEMFDSIVAVSMIPKPFGFVWDVDKIKEFLVARGYKIFKQPLKEDSGDFFEVAVKSDSLVVPSDVDSNIRSVFDREVQDILLKWLLKIAKK